MLGSPCSPCCDNSGSCRAAFNYLVSQTHSVTISGSFPGQSPATLINSTSNPFDDGSSQQLPYILRGTPRPPPNQFYDDWVAISPEEQTATLTRRAAFSAFYYRAGESADGTHELALDLGSTASTASGGSMIFRKTTPHYLIALRIIVGNGGQQSLPGISCPLGISLDVIQYGYVRGGVISPGMKQAVGALQVAINNFVTETVTVNATPVIRWPDSQYVATYPGLQPDEHGTYSVGRFIHYWQSDLSSANVTARQVRDSFGNLLAVEVGDPAPFSWDSVSPYQSLNFNNATPYETVSDAGGVTSMRMAGQLVAYGGAWRWVTASGAGAFLQPLSAGGVTFFNDNYNALGFYARTTPPAASTATYARRSISGLDVVANIRHP
jgi:hypothetical protein